jgi:hypothetical protein
MQNPLSDTDIDALLRVLTIVEDHVVEACGSIVARQLRDGFVASGLLPDDAKTDVVGRAVAQLQLRYRYSLGEYEERPADGASETHAG